MARSPFSGTFQPNLRPTVVTAPDAMVLINGNSQIVGCPACNRSFDINKYVTSITVDLAVDSVPGSASISLQVPRHTIDDLFFDGTLVISPMMEVNIYAKGYYLVNGLPQYYPIFWGLVTEATEAYSSGEHTVSIHCADILKWWELCRMDINSSLANRTSQQPKIQLHSNSFQGMHPYDIIWTLAQQGFGDIVTAGGTIATAVAQKNPQNNSFNLALNEAAAYWQQRFQAITTNLMIYGATGSLVRGDQLQRQAKNGKTPLGILTSQDFANGAGTVGFNPRDTNVVAMHTDNTNLSVNAWQSEYQTKLEIANACKEAIGYEFYMDVTGDIVFKPPFYNLDILSNKPVSWIQDIDVIEWDLGDSEGDVITQLTVGGNFAGNTDVGGGSELNLSSSVTDYHLVRKYGWRTQQVQSEFLPNDKNALTQFGLDMLDKINAKRHRGTVTIPLRPELRLGFPVYLASQDRDQIWYVSGISHNIAFGSRATTTLTIVAKREKFKAPQGICTLTLAKPPTSVTPSGGSFPYTGKALSQQGVFALTVPSGSVGGPAVSPIPANQTGSSDSSPYKLLILRSPQTGMVLGYPNVVMSYFTPNYVTATQANIQAGRGVKPAPVAYQNTGGLNLGPTATTVDAAQSAASIPNPVSNLNTTYLSDAYMFGFTTAGAYVYAHDVGIAGTSPPVGVISDLVQLPGGRMTVKSIPNIPPPLPRETLVIRPVSDERGFEVIGHSRYGRGLTLSNGQLTQTNAPPQPAIAEIQVALSGNLFTALTAQSQGLVQGPQLYNPANVIATLQPTDLQTSGFTSGPKNTPSYGNTGSNFTTVTPVTNPPSAIYGSVQAAQLSQGLTLAEMTVLDPTGADVDGINATQAQCMCLLGRADLAFMNPNYSATLLPPVVGDNFTLPTGEGAYNDITNATTTGQNEVNLDLGITSNSPLDQVTTYVDNFLFSLYQTLDTPHQQYEQQLRGGIYQAPQNGQGQAVNPSATDLGPTAPPFSAANRFAVGDLLADAQMASSAAGNLTKAWNTFGTTLQASVSIATLSAQIGGDQANLTVLQALLTQAQSQSADNSVGYAGPSVASLEAKIATLQQKIETETTQLGQARNAQAQAGPVPNVLGG